MTKEELAAKLNGNQIGREITKALAKEAKEAGLVVVYGASDDLVEFEGAIYDEAGAYDGGEVFIADGKLFNEDECESHCRFFKEAMKKVRKTAITAVWNDEGNPCWSYKTQIPHATFEIYEDKELFCRGIVFGLADV